MTDRLPDVTLGATNSRARYWRVGAYPQTITVLETNTPDGVRLFCLTCRLTTCKHVRAVEAAPPVPSGIESTQDGARTLSDSEEER